MVMRKGLYLCLDHVWPWASSGPNTLDNFQLLRPSCNGSNSEDEKWDFRCLFPDFLSNAQQYEKEYQMRTDHNLYFECIPSESHQTSTMKWLYNATRG